MAILRRLSARFHRKQETNAPETNGTQSRLKKVEENKPLNGTNGVTNGVTNGSANLTDSLAETKKVNRRHPSWSTPSKPAPARQDTRDRNSTPATRQDVENTFAEFAQLIHASRRPLPTQSGDGSYLEKEEPTGFWNDIRHLGLKDLNTVKNILADKASGKPQDDRNLHMEGVMQVRLQTRYAE